MLIRLLLVISFLQIFFVAQAQTIEIGVNVIPTISYRFMGANPSTEPRSVTMNVSERPIHSFDFGIDVRKRIGKKLKMGSGIFYSQKGFGNTNLSGTYNIEKISKANSIDFVQDYIEVPFFLSYNIAESKKFETYPVLGITNAILVNSKNHVADKSGTLSQADLAVLKKPYLKSQQTHNVGLLVGWGLALKADDRTSVGLEFQSKNMLTALEDTVYASKRYLNSIGLSFRFIRKL